jgi:hypothetical protein
MPFKNTLIRFSISVVLFGWAIFSQAADPLPQKIHRSTDSAGRVTWSDLPTQRSSSLKVDSNASSEPSESKNTFPILQDPTKLKSPSQGALANSDFNDECKKAKFNLKLLEVGQKIRIVEGQNSKSLSENDVAQMKQTMAKSVQVWCSKSETPAETATD